MSAGTFIYIMTHQASGRLLIAVAPPYLDVSPESFSFSTNCFLVNNPGYGQPATDWFCTARLRNHWIASDDLHWTASSSSMLGITFSQSSGTLVPGSDVQVDITIPVNIATQVITQGKNISITFSGSVNSEELVFSQ